jgi:hypothetical protein
MQKQGSSGLGRRRGREPAGEAIPSRDRHPSTCPPANPLGSAHRDQTGPRSFNPHETPAAWTEIAAAPPPGRGRAPQSRRLGGEGVGGRSRARHCLGERRRRRRRRPQARRARRAARARSLPRRGPRRRALACPPEPRLRRRRRHARWRWSTRASASATATRTPAAGAMAWCVRAVRRGAAAGARARARGRRRRPAARGPPTRRPPRLAAQRHRALPLGGRQRVHGAVAGRREARRRHLQLAERRDLPGWVGRGGGALEARRGACRTRGRPRAAGGGAAAAPRAAAARGGRARAAARETGRQARRGGALGSTFATAADDDENAHAFRPPSPRRVAGGLHGRHRHV